MSSVGGGSAIGTPTVSTVAGSGTPSVTDGIEPLELSAARAKPEEVEQVARSYQDAVREKEAANEAAYAAFQVGGRCNRCNRCNRWDALGWPFVGGATLLVCCGARWREGGEARRARHAPHERPVLSLMRTRCRTLRVTTSIDLARPRLTSLDLA